MKKIGAGIIGLGVGRQHALAFAAHPDCRVAHLCDSDPAQRAWAEKQHPDAKFSTDARDLIGDPAVDVVAVASYDDDHAGQILAALKAGQHVFAEKPLCTRAEDAAAIRAELARHPELRLSSNLILRRYPVFRELQSRLRAGELGEVYALEGDYNYGRLHKLTEGWRGRSADYSVILGGGVHIADLLLWLVGAPAEEVYSLGNAFASRGSAFPGPDYACSLVRFRGGAVGKVSANFGCVHPHFHNVSVYGTRATFTHGPAGTFLHTSRDPAVAPLRLDLHYPGCAKGDLIADFIEEILGRGRAEVNAEDVFRCMELCFAMEKSLRSRVPLAVTRL